MKSRPSTCRRVPDSSSTTWTTGTWAAASGVFTVMRTSSEPARASASTCRAVDSASAVSVLVIDCTTIGASPPMVTLPTRFTGVILPGSNWMTA